MVKILLRDILPRRFYFLYAINVRKRTAELMEESEGLTFCKICAESPSSWKIALSAQI